MARLDRPVALELANASSQRRRTRRQPKKEYLVDTVIVPPLMNRDEATAVNAITLTLRVEAATIVRKTKATRVEIAIGKKARGTQMNGSHEMTVDRSKPRAVVSFPLQPDQGGGLENLHAVYVRGDEYVLDNIPFYALGISCGDTVNVQRVGECLMFQSVVLRGGHSTYRLKLPIGKGHDAFSEIWDILGRLGCTYEGSSLGLRRLYAIDIPPGTDVSQVYSFLESLEQQGAIEFEEGHYFDQRN